MKSAGLLLLLLLGAVAAAAAGSSPSSSSGSFSAPASTSAGASTELGSLAMLFLGTPLGGGGWRGAIDGYVFNSPFWSWNLAWYEKRAVQTAYKTGLPDEFLVDEGGAESEYGRERG